MIYKSKLLMFIIIFVTQVAILDARIYLLEDKNLAKFKYTFKLENSVQYVIERLNIEGPYYDGPTGYNVLKIRKHIANKPPEDILTLLLKGQYHLFAFDMGKKSVYAYKVKPIGTDLIINGIVIFSKSHEEGLPAGSKGEYQYASCNPTGEYCLLIDDKINILNLSTFQTHTYQDKVIFTGFEADPTRNEIDGSTYIGGNYNLSGNYMSMKWETEFSGKITIFNHLKKNARDIPIDLSKIPSLFLKNQEQSIAPHNY